MFESYSGIRRTGMEILTENSYKTVTDAQLGSRPAVCAQSNAHNSVLDDALAIKMIVHGNLTYFHGV